MIPKIIHWCWLSGDPLPLNIYKCIESWKSIMPDYEIKCWTTNEFDVFSVEFVKDAFLQKKWAFCADYIRAYALYMEGGIYLDSDVQVLKSFDSILNYNFFSSVEYLPDNVALFEVEKKCLDENFNRKVEIPYVTGIGIQAAVMGSVKGNKYLKNCLEYYSNLKFKIGKGYDNMAIIAPNVYAICAENFGFKYRNINQLLFDNMMIFKDEVFCIPEFKSTKTMALHLVAHSWYEPTKKQIIYNNLSKIKVIKYIFIHLEKSKFTKRIIRILKWFVWHK